MVDLIQLRHPEQPLAWHGQWAGFPIASPVSLPGLAACPAQLGPSFEISHIDAPTRAGTLHGYGRQWALRYGHERDAILISCGPMRAQISADRTRWQGPVDNPRLIPLLTGPVILLALAHRMCFAVHASAFQTATGAVLLVGASGAGKSTLATHAEKRWRTRISDDVTPVSMSDGQLNVPGSLPQLKLDPPFQPTPPARVTAIVELSPGTCDPPQMTRMSTTKALLRMLRHTVASRLFNPELLDAHLRFMSLACTLAPVYQMDYRQDMDSIEPCLETIVASCE